MGTYIHQKRDGKIKRPASVVETKTGVSRIIVSSLSFKKQTLDAPCRDGSPDGHGRFNPRENGDAYIGNVVKGSISHSDTLGCFSPPVDSSQPTCTIDKFMKIMISFSKKLSWLNKYYKNKAFKQDHCRENLPSTLSRLSLFG